MKTKAKVINKLFSVLPIFLIWLFGFFLRSYRQSDLLTFHYDQGRDAQIASDILAFRNFPTIGPTTGIEGLFLGPFWFYLITPGYFLSSGHPAGASIFISFLESLTIPLIFLIIKKYFSSTKAAYLGAILWAFSNFLIRSSRWFSNPSPLPFFVLLILFCLLKVFQDKDARFFPPIFLLLGLTLQLEAASAVFFIPTVLLFFLLNRKSIVLKVSSYFKGIVLFLILLLPQLAFELKNNFFITRSFLNFIFGKSNTNTGSSWAIPTLSFAQNRLVNFYNAFFSKLDTNLTQFSVVLFIIFIFSLFFLLKTHRKNLLVQLSFLWTFVPLAFLMFFVGNYGNLYDYYLTGFFPSFIILFSLSLFSFKERYLSLLLAAITLFIFFQGNFIYVRDYLSAGVDGPEHITLGNQIQSIEKICELSKDANYNLTIYVPPIIPNSYNYLLTWYQNNGKCSPPSPQNEPYLLTLYEVDPPHPERLKNWIDQISSYSLLTNRYQYGGIFVEERQQISQ
ncbi:MAG: ArnT family glycosyltransferase [Patescibacteria group bacterium]|jgi:4-amino-4-deoxy-L-arabinose transferase-like glycosyltransferase